MKRWTLFNFPFNEWISVNTFYKLKHNNVFINMKILKLSYNWPNTFHANTRNEKHTPHKNKLKCVYTQNQKTKRTFPIVICYGVLCFKRRRYSFSLVRRWKLVPQTTARVSGKRPNWTNTLFPSSGSLFYQILCE